MFDSFQLMPMIRDPYADSIGCWYGYFGLCASLGCLLSAVQTNALRDQIEPNRQLASAKKGPHVKSSAWASSFVRSQLAGHPSFARVPADGTLLTSLNHRDPHPTAFNCKSASVVALNPRPKTP